MRQCRLHVCCLCPRNIPPGFRLRPKLAYGSADHERATCARERPRCHLHYRAQQVESWLCRGWHTSCGMSPLSREQIKQSASMWLWTAEWPRVSNFFPSLTMRCFGSLFTRTARGTPGIPSYTHEFTLLAYLTKFSSFFDSITGDREPTWPITCSVGGEEPRNMSFLRTRVDFWSYQFLLLICLIDNAWKIHDAAAGLKCTQCTVFLHAVRLGTGR